MKRAAILTLRLHEAAHLCKRPVSSPKCDKGKKRRPLKITPTLRGQNRLPKIRSASENHFASLGKMVSLGSGARHKVKDYRLSRYACHLIVQNGELEENSVISFLETTAEDDKNYQVKYYTPDRGCFRELPERVRAIRTSERRVYQQIADAFNMDRSVATRHINKIFNDGEVSRKSNVQKMHFAHSDTPFLIITRMPSQWPPSGSA